MPPLRLRPARDRAARRGDEAVARRCSPSILDARGVAAPPVATPAYYPKGPTPSPTFRSVAATARPGTRPRRGCGARAARAPAAPFTDPRARSRAVRASGSVRVPVMARGPGPSAAGARRRRRARAGFRRRRTRRPRRRRLRWTSATPDRRLRQRRADVRRRRARGGHAGGGEREVCT